MSGAYEILFTSLRCALRLLLPAPLPIVRHRVVSRIHRSNSLRPFVFAVNPFSFSFSLSISRMCTYVKLCQCVCAWYSWTTLVTIFVSHIALFRSMWHWRVEWFGRLHHGAIDPFCARALTLSRSWTSGHEHERGCPRVRALHDKRVGRAVVGAHIAYMHVRHGLLRLVSPLFASLRLVSLRFVSPRSFRLVSQ